MDTLEIGQVILGKYKISRHLGKGGMGTVVAALRLDVDVTVALKFLHASLRATPGVTARFLHEARAGMRIKSPHVAQVHDVVTTDDMSFIVMEYLSGKDFAALLGERGPLPILEVADLLLQAAEAIALAHTLGIIHRDLKPQNLFLTEGPDGLRLVKVLDFGIAKSIASDDMSMTATTGTLGSPRYMSPEQIASPKDVDARTDVWSLGVILYELLTGKPPFVGDTHWTISASIRSGIYVPLLDVRPDLSPELAAVVSEALAVERDARFASVEAFAAKLATFGTDAARSSYAHIKRVAARTPPPMETAPVLSAQPVGGGAPTSAGQGTSLSETPPPTVDTVPEKPSPTPRAPASRWRTKLALGAVGTAVAALSVGLSGVGRGSRTPEVQAPVAPSPISIASAAPMNDAGGTPPTVAMTSEAPTPSASAAPPVAAELSARPAPKPAEVPPPTGCAKGATAACEAACVANAPGSCLALAGALEKGIGAPKDPQRAARIYDKACTASDPAACNALGSLYGRGVGVTHNASKAVALYVHACDAEFARGCLNLGSMHFTGDGVPKNESLGARFFLRACDGHEPLGCLNLSIAYAGGKGVPRNADQAFVYARKACTGGAPMGCIRVGLATIEGQGVTKDVKGGIAQIDAMCTHHDADACETLEGMYSRGDVPDVPMDPVQQRVYAKKACDLGAKKSCGAAEVLPAQDHLESTAGQAAALIRAKCDGGVCGRVDGGVR